MKMLHICSMDPMANNSGQQKYEEVFNNPCNPQFPCPFCSTQASEEDTSRARTNSHGRTYAPLPSSAHSVLAVEKIRCYACQTSSAPPTNVVLLSGHPHLSQGQIPTREQPVPLISERIWPSICRSLTPSQVHKYIISGLSMMKSMISTVIFLQCKTWELPAHDHCPVHQTTFRIK